jgi:hypothetical protein
MALIHQEGGGGLRGEFHSTLFAVKGFVAKKVTSKAQGGVAISTGEMPASPHLKQYGEDEDERLLKSVIFASTGFPE